MARIKSGGSLNEKLTRIIESIPKEGCLIVFNAPHDLVRAAVGRVAPGLLRTHVLESGHVNPDVAYAEIRDLYIRWRD